MVERWPQFALVAAMIPAAMLANGCAEKRAHVYPWATAIAVRPRTPIAAPGRTAASVDESAPDLPWNLVPPPSLSIMRQPARPRVPVQAAPEPPENVKTEAPLLAPQLSQQEIAAAQQQMNESLGVAHTKPAGGEEPQTECHADRPGVQGEFICRRVQSRSEGRRLGSREKFGQEGSTTFRRTCEFAVRQSLNTLPHSKNEKASTMRADRSALDYLHGRCDRMQK